MGKQETVMERAKPTNTHSNIDRDDATSKIETIRNLIFGENIQEYNSEFDALKSDILRKKKDLETLVQEVHRDLRSALDNVAADVNTRITELEDKLDHKIENLDESKVDKAMFAKMLIDLGEKLGQK